MKTLVILGATSAISQAYVSRVAERYERIVLVARNAEAIGQIADHLRVTSSRVVETVTADFSDIDAHSQMVDELFASSVDSVLVSYGELTDQNRCGDDTVYAMQQFNLNATSTISLSALTARKLADQGGGTLVVVGSVAGDRGRRSNYFYGAAKSAVASFLSGLRSDMSRFGVAVITVKPGFVDTPMTKEFSKGLLWVSAEKVAADIDKAVTRGKNILYTPWFWRYIMWVIKAIPEGIFKRLPL